MQLDLHSGTKFQQQLGSTLSSYMAAVDLLGRLHIMQNTKARAGIENPALVTTAVIPKFDDANVLGFTKVSSEQAVEQIANLNAVTRRMYDGLQSKYRQQAFTVSYVTDKRIIEQIQAKLEETVAKGGGVAAFNKQLDQLASDEGIVQLEDWHIENVFRTNVQTAYMTGRLEQMRDPDTTDALPYWEYFAVIDDRTRLSHAQMNHFVAKFDDPVWAVWYPPAGFNCRCSVFPILESEAPDNADVPGLTRIRSYPDEGFGGLSGLLN